MRDFDLGCMEAQPGPGSRLRTIALVPQERAAHVRQVHADLMGPPGLEPEVEPRAPGRIPVQDLEMRDGRAAVLCDDPQGQAWPASDGCPDGSGVQGDIARHDGHVPPRHYAPRQGIRKPLGGPRIASHDEQARRSLIEPVDQMEGAIAGCQGRGKREAVDARGRVHDPAGWLVHHRDEVVLVHDLEIGAFRNDPGRPVGQIERQALSRHYPHERRGHDPIHAHAILGPEPAVEGAR